MIRRNPVIAVPTILARLRQKDEEWRRIRLEMRPRWARIMAENETPSLDVRTFMARRKDAQAHSSRELLRELYASHRMCHPPSFPSATKESAQSAVSASGRDQDFFSLNFPYQRAEGFAVHHALHQVVTAMIRKRIKIKSVRSERICRVRI